MKSNIDLEEMYTLEEVADILQFDVERVEQLVKNDVIFSVDFDHIASSDLQDYVLNENIESEVFI